VYTRAAPRNRRSSAFVNRSLLKSKFRCIRMFSVVRQCTLCVLYASTLRSVLSSSELHFAPFGGVSKRERTKHELSQNQCSKCITSVELLYLVFSIVSDTHPGARVESLGSVLCVSCDSRAHDDTAHTHETHMQHMAFRGSVSKVLSAESLLIEYSLQQGQLDRASGFARRRRGCARWSCQEGALDVVFETLTVCASGLCLVSNGEHFSAARWMRRPLLWYHILYIYIWYPHRCDLCDVWWKLVLVM
jgi:hypothetical protein